MEIEYKHQMSAHCENGVISSLLGFHGISLSEPMAFGIGSGLFFIHFPFIKMHGIPVTAFRPMPGMIFNRVMKKMGIKVHSQRFRKPDTSMKELDKLLALGIPVGLVVGVYHLTYFPAPLRFHFNGHNIVVCGKKGDQYLVSDPVMEEKTWISYEDLKRVRFARGTYSPRGKMYYIRSVPAELPSMKDIVSKSIKQNCFAMLKIPGKIAGVEGISYLGRRVKKYKQKHSERKANLYLGQIVRMLEEIGTGGAGFRFLYAAFLQESARLLGDDTLRDYAHQLTDIGDMWRNFSSRAAQVCKNRSQEDTFESVGSLLEEIGVQEAMFFTELRKKVRKA